MTPRLRFRWFENGFLVLGLLLLALWARTELESHDFQSRETGKLEAALRAAEAGLSPDLASNAEFIGPPESPMPNDARSPDSALGRIEIPRLRIAAIVAEGSDAKTLRRAVGHIPSTALPGKPGNCALAGHRDSFFRGLGAVLVGDVITLVTPSGTYAYQVEWTEVVEPRRVDVIAPTPERSLTLVTCYPFAFVGHAPKRFVVRARQVETAIAGGAGPTAAGEID